MWFFESVQACVRLGCAYTIYFSGGIGCRKITGDPLLNFYLNLHMCWGCTEAQPIDNSSQCGHVAWFPLSSFRLQCGALTSVTSTVMRCAAVKVATMNLITTTMKLSTLRMSNLDCSCTASRMCKCAQRT